MAENNNNTNNNSWASQLSATYVSPLVVGIEAPQGLVDHTCALIQNDLFIFGGFDSSTKKQSHVLYRFDLQNRQWINLWKQYPEKQKSSTNKPVSQTEKTVENISPRIGHSCASVGNKLFIFGGMNESYLSDFWSYNIDLDTWSHLTTKNGPPAIAGHTCIPFNKHLYLFGGLIGATNTASSQLFCFNIEQNTWQLVQPQSTSQIPSRFDHTAVIYNSSMWVFGGCSGGQYHNDIFRYQFDTMQWTKVEAKGNPNEIPQPRSRHIAVLYSDHMIISGGSDRSTWFQDLWIFDFQLCKWTGVDLGQIESFQKLEIGVSRRDHTAVLYKDSLIIFGGKSRASYHDNRLVSFDLSNLKQKFQASPKFQNKVGAGNVYSMGFGKHGQLGLGGEGQERLSPSLVSKLAGSLVTKIACGGGHTVAVTAKGELFQWGDESGVGLAFTPHLVTELRDEVVLDAACGSLHTIAITKSDQQDTAVAKKVYNDNIKREKDAKPALQSTKVFVWGDNVADVKPTPRVLSSLENKAVSQIACTALSTIMLTKDQFVYSWFIENENQLTLIATPEEKICKISCGGNHVLLLSENGLAFSYGGNKYGQLGHGNTQDCTEPTLIKGVANIVEIGCGPDHSLLVDSTGAVYSFGRNDTYQLGHGNKENQSSPRPIQALEGVRVISVAAGGGLGGSCSVCISDSGECYTWGSGKFGQLGHGDKSDKEIPTKIQNLPGRALQAACGWMHTTLLIADSTEISTDNSRSTLGYFALLPRDMMRELLLFLDIVSLVKLSVLSSAMKSITNEEYLWNAIFDRQFAAKYEYKRNYGIDKAAVIDCFLKDNPSYRLKKFQGPKDMGLTSKFKSAVSGFKFGKMMFGGIEARCLMVGLDAAGKTTILYMLKLGEVVTTIPTIGFNVETVPIKEVRFTFWDVGGPDKIRPLWRHYYQNTQMVINVIDSNDRDRLPEAAEELQKMLAEDELHDCILLVFANKQDLPNALPASQIAEVLGLAHLKRPWMIQPCCATTGDGLYEGLEWAVETLKQKA